MMLIDPPSDFAPLAEWKEFKTRMEALAVKHPDDESVRECLALAKDRVDELSA
ncbi:hypothetical protein [Sphingomonas sp.]|uniref:hypothetical protein n=1 Tax=Sphingomonas sp. TaxID=28214 RepID=UPI0025E212B2|nr:hypothetical protein [Sphingomonas sp.]